MIEIAGGVSLGLKDQRLVASIPPAMPYAARKECSFARTECDGLAVHDSREPPADYFPALVLINMDVHRRPLAMRRQAAFEMQHLATVLNTASQVQPLTGVAIVQVQHLIHQPHPSACYA